MGGAIELDRGCVKLARSEFCFIRCDKLKSGVSFGNRFVRNEAELRNGMQGTLDKVTCTWLTE